MVLKTYARLVTHDVDQSLDLLRRLHGTEPHLRVTFGALDLAMIGDVIVVGGPEEVVAPQREIQGPLVVDDVAATRRTLEQAGATVTQEIPQSPTGHGFVARHPDGSRVEYVEWTPDLVERWIEAPRRAGTLSSQVGP